MNVRLKYGRAIGCEVDKPDNPLIWHIGGEDAFMRIPLLKRLEVRGFRVGVVGSGPSKPFKDAGIFYCRYQLHRWVAPLADFVSLKQLVTLFRHHRPDVVHAFDTKPSILAMIAAAQAGIPGRVRTITGMGYLFSSQSILAQTLRPVYRFFQKRASQHAGLTIFQNPDDMAEFIRNLMVRREECRLVFGSGIDLQKFSPDKFGSGVGQSVRTELGLGYRPVVIMIARLVRTKGVLEYLRAARQVKLARPDVTFLLIGPYASEGRQAVSLGEVGAFENWVHYLGHRDDVPELLSASDLFVLPSYYREGVPRVLLEAGAMGLPLITTDMPGCREAVIEGQNGWLVEPRNEEALAQVIIRALDINRNKLREMGIRGAEYIREKFDLEKVADAYSAIYREALDGAARVDAS